ncbi:nickel-responsive transcriptional regulator NikR [Derxia gummosa]|uniref:Putative nickel-responsive regulator n=1 Tax=Derxia gummosa DSM 723 TaxID=1121388 RepID=A0A8B6X8N6_9BURK|nr:nickel-responsive transcriptional regulator NikR [Derxia gummosa]
MDRLTISLPEDLATAFDRLIARQGYGNRSEAMRDLIRRAVENDRLARAEAPHCVASVSYVYNHHERVASDRLMEVQHEHHDLTVASLHAHLDHEHCIETLLLKGPTNAVRQCAERIVAERGVRHGNIHVVPLVEVGAPHVHGHGHAHDHPHDHPHDHGDAEGKPHVHLRPGS